MGLLAGKNCRIHIAGYDISGKSNKFSLPMSRKYKDVTCFGHDGHKWFPTLKSQSFEFNAFFDTDADGVQTCLQALRGNTQAVISIQLGNTIEDPAIGAYGALQDVYEMEGSPADMLALKSAFKPEEAFIPGYMVAFPKATQTSDSSHTAIDNAVASILGAEAILQVFACGDDDALVVTIQHSIDNFVADTEDLITFTEANGITAERLELTAKSGTADATEANKLHDADGGFAATDVGKTVWNTTDDTYTTVAAFVDSGELTLTDDIMADTEEYTVGAVRRYVRVAWSGTPTYSATFAVIFKRN